jgi:hypothetical protein
VANLQLSTHDRLSGTHSRRPHCCAWSAPAHQAPTPSSASSELEPSRARSGRPPSQPHPPAAPPTGGRPAAGGVRGRPAARRRRRWLYPAGPVGRVRGTARGVRLAPDGRLLVTDLGTGRSDGKVVAVDLAAGHRQVLLDRLPSTRRSGQQHADLAGPSGAAMAPDGTVCAVIGIVSRWKKSAARMPSACADRNCRHVSPARCGAGSMPARSGSSHTVLGATGGIDGRPSGR